MRSRVTSPGLSASRCHRAIDTESVTRRFDYADRQVKWFNAQKGYGFIQPTGGGGDVFVNISAAESAGLNLLNEGQSVEYEIESNRGKESAVSSS